MVDSNREPSFGRGDVSRSMTRNSHYSHASTRSWVLSNQQNPPPPPDISDPIPSPVRTPRPLPNPQLPPQPQNQIPRVSDADLLDEDEEQMNIEANDVGIGAGYEREGLDQGGTSGLAPTPPSSRDVGGRSFVGGFVNGLRRLPRVVLRYGTLGDKRKFFRHGTLGSRGTVTSATGMTTGNTLPLYASNPPTPLGVSSTTQYVHSTEMPIPVPAEELPQVVLGPSLSQLRHHPTFRMTPPSEELADQGPVENPHPMFPPTPLEFADDSLEPPRNGNTATAYHISGQQDFPTEELPLPLPTPTPNRRPESRRQPSAPDATPARTPSQSPILAPPASNYRKMVSSPLSQSPTTFSTSLTSESSFSSELNPVKRFFLRLNHLPWVATERVTVDYRPRGHGSGKRKGWGIVKRPASSWYKGKPGLVLFMKPRNGELDLLSSRSGSKQTNSGTPPTPAPTRAGHPSSDHRRHRHRRRHRRTTEDDIQEHSNGNRAHRHRNTPSPRETYAQHNGSPTIPAVYPYTYPYPYPYQAFPPPEFRSAHSQSSPRGPRPNSTQAYPRGYAAFQGPQLPVYVIHSPTPANSPAGSGQTQPQVLTPVYVPTQLVPGVYNQEQAPAVTFSPGDCTETGEV